MTVIDMEAGLEHLSRSGGTLAYADALLVVMEPTRKSVLTAARTLALAEELGIPRTLGVGNKVMDDADAEFFASACAEVGLPLAGTIPADQSVSHADRRGEAVTANAPAAVRTAVEDIVSFLEGARV